MKEIRAIKCKDSAVESLISGEFSGFVYVGIFSLSLLLLLAVQGAYFIAYRGWKVGSVGGSAVCFHLNRFACRAGRCGVVGFDLLPTADSYWSVPQI